MKLFIDTNVFLAFYHYSSDDLEELRKLVALVKAREIELYLPTQVRDEFHRNREVKIADAMKRLRDAKLSLSFPQFAKSYDEYKDLRDLLRKTDKAHSKLLEVLTRDALATSLQADEVIESLFSLAEEIPLDATILKLARQRVDRGSPPGKGQSVGDAINWESLLAAVSVKHDLVLISDDKDYVSPLDDSRLNAFLDHEWREAKSSQVIFFRALSPFFKKHYPQITLATEAEKDLLIRDLAASGSFSTTHLIVAKLANYAEFSEAQANAIASATTSNSQVRLIISDPDIRRFLRTVLAGRELENDLSKKLKAILSDSDSDDDE